MRAAVFEARGLPLVVEEVDRPAAGPGEAVLRVRACGICGSDLHATEADGVLAPGAVLGHEVTGDIVEIGEGALGEWRVGERVFSLPRVTCGRCHECAAGRSHLCATVTYIGALAPGELPGGYAEYMRAGTNDLVRLPARLSYGIGALLDPLGTALACLRLAGMELGARAAVLGGGPIGLSIVLLCRLFGAPRVVLVEPNAQRRAVGMQVGATAAFDLEPAGVLPAEVIEACGGPPDVVFEAVGRPGQLNRAIGLVRRRGTVVAAGVCMEPDTFDHLAACVKEPTVVMPSTTTVEDARYLAELLEQGRIDPSPLLTHTVSLDELPAAFEALRRPADQIKVIVVP
ncbi:MAG: alcohol dehydrogenase catalytic domain-containing protein [Thermoleophilia bacterium]|nr:alcohol dehydrogenase catalytic domain-containing protein [Thermoleophilia bacterium]